VHMNTVMIKQQSSRVSVQLGKVHAGMGIADQNNCVCIPEVILHIPPVQSLDLPPSIGCFPDGHRHHLVQPDGAVYKVVHDGRYHIEHRELGIRIFLKAVREHASGFNSKNVGVRVIYRYNSHRMHDKRNHRFDDSKVVSEGTMPWVFWGQPAIASGVV
jgi:hypothetical protein